MSILRARLSAERVAPSLGLVERRRRRRLAKGGPQLRLESGEIAAQRLLRTHRSRLQVSNDLFERPCARLVEGAARHVGEASLPQHPLMAAGTHLRAWA